MHTNILLLLLLVPLGIGIINLFVPVWLKKVMTFLGLGLNLYLVYSLYMHSANSVIFFNDTIFSIDQVGIFAITFVQLLSFIILIFSLKGVEKDAEKRFFLLYPITVSFCNGVILSEHIFSFIIFWGLSGLTLYLFALLGKNYNTPKTAKKTFIIIGGSDAFLIMGLIMMWMLKGQSGWSLANMEIPLQGWMAIFAFIFLQIAAFAKAGGFPFHTWVPDFCRDTPIECSAFLPASLDKLLGIYLLTRMMTTLFSFDILLNLIVITFGALTVIIAVMMALTQHNGRKLLGYHAVSQVGYMIIGVGSGSALAFAGGLFHLVNHTIYKSNLFLTLGSVEKQTGTCDLEKLGGLGRNMPITFIMALIGALSISGIPPFNGFFSKWMIYQGLIEKTATLSNGFQLWLLACLILAIFGSALTLASFMKFLHAIYLGKRPTEHNDVKEAPVNQWLSTGLFSLLCVAFGLFAVELPLKHFIYPVVQSAGMRIPDFTGLYTPQLIVILFAIAFIIAAVVFMLNKKVRYDDVYLGGMEAEEKFRIAGTEFYNEIRNMTLIKNMYNWAEKQYFDLYDMGASLTFSISRIFQRAHPGLLQLYLLYILIGLVIFFALIK